MNHRFKFHTRLRFAFGVAMLVIAALIAASWHAASEVREAAFWVEHTHEVSNRLNDARSDSLLIELNTQNYRITGNAEHLDARDAAMAAREVALRRIMQLTADNPRQQERWARLRVVIDERLAISRRVELLRQTEGAAAANTYVAGAPLRETRERLFATLREMDEEESHLLQERNAEQSRVRNLRHALSAISVLLLLALLAATYVMVRRQIAERSQVEAALRESEESLSTTLHSIGDAVLATDTDGRIVRMNPVAERLTGWPLGEALGRPIAEVFRIVNEQTRAPAEVPVARVLATGEVHGLANHTLLIARDDTEWPIADSAAPICDAGGGVSGVVLVFHDMTVERAAERLIREQNALLEQRVRERTAQLRESEQRFRLLAEGAIDYAIIMLDPRGRVVTWNEGARRLKGYADADIIGRSIDCFYPAEDVAAGKPACLLAQAATEGRVEDEGWRLRQDGTRFFADVVLTALRDQAGELVGFAKITRDISEKKRAEQEMLDLNASLEQRVAERTVQLEEANRAKSDFLANMSHELRTPLNAIIGFSEMLKDGLLGELGAKQRGFVADIFDAGTHLLSLINDILDLSKVEAGMLRLDAEAVDLPALLQASMLIVREKALAHRIRLDTRLDPALDTVLADERKLKQIVYNLLSNAVKFTPEDGTVTLSARRCTRSEVAPEAGPDAAMPARLIALPPGADEEFVVITVEDSGVGIAEADLAKLYEPFTQVDSSVARRHAGTGLGLSLVRRLAELHGGTVGVASRPGAGSRFSVWLPYREFTGEHEPASPPSVALQEGGATPAATLPLRPIVPLALVIEDDDRTADLITTQLDGEGFAVMRTATAEEGLVRAAKHRPQLITLDIFLPHMDGWEFMQRLRADPRLAATPVVIITVSSDLDRGLALGARRVLHKPFSRDELVTALAGLVDARPDGVPTRVLVVDDNVKAVELVATVLEAEGCRVLRAYGGAEAIEVAKSALPDLVILDLMMPEVNGFEVAHALREAERTAQIPILVLTAKDLSAEDHAYLNGKVQAVLVKVGFSARALLVELQRALPGRAKN